MLGEELASLWSAPPPFVARRQELDLLAAAWSTGVPMVVEGEPGIRRVELRNSVLVIYDTESKALAHVDVTGRGMAEFILERKLPAGGGEVLAELDGTLDRSHLMLGAVRAPATAEPRGKAKYNDG